jgi:hypothetical protein
MHLVPIATPLPRQQTPQSTLWQRPLQSSTPRQCTQAVHPGSAPRQYTQAVHSGSTPRQYTQAVHPGSAPRQYTQAVHPGSTPRQCTQAVHPGSAPRQYTQAVHPGRTDSRTLCIEQHLPREERLSMQKSGCGTGRCFATPPSSVPS